MVSLIRRHSPPLAYLQPMLEKTAFTFCIAWTLSACDLGPKTVQFADVTAQSGISFTHTNGAAGEYFLIETTGAGGAFLRL